jgi:threonine dehydratase
VLNLSDVEAAAARLQGIVHRTPVITSRALDRLARCDVRLKAENLQQCGAFKLRGAFYKIASLEPTERDRGVVAFSSENHAQAVAFAASLLRTNAVVLIPTDAPIEKLRAARGFGAEVITFDRRKESRQELACALTDERDMTLVPPYDDWHVMAGQGTAALELIEDVGPLDALVVPVGGGGLIAGCATVARGVNQRTRVIGVERPEAMTHSALSPRAGGSPSTSQT